LVGLPTASVEFYEKQCENISDSDIIDIDFSDIIVEDIDIKDIEGNDE
jgi:hypothetical protein